MFAYRAILHLSLFALAFGICASVGCGPKEPNAGPPINENQDPPQKSDPPNAASLAKPKQAGASQNAVKDDKLEGPAITVAPKPLSQELLDEGWISLFDGQTFFGWQKNTEADWSIEDGAIMVTDGEVGLLTTTSQFADYELHVEFKSDLGVNSGIFLRTPHAPKSPQQDCYELNIAPADNPFPTGSLVGRQKVEGDHHKNDWQAFDVTVIGDRVTVKLDGVELLDYRDSKPHKKGHIGLQLNQGRVAFREIRLRPLNLQSIFNGKDLEGWKVPASESVFSVTETGELNVKNGRGHIETEDHYDDFVMQLDCISHAPSLNSGIFFRCVPDSKMDGYESQIHNGFADNDRRISVDHGTGGIFRRQKARLVVADDLKWFTKTIVADGPRIAVWVNGYQVSDWIDERPADPNPRRGLRTEAGSIMIQGHDPTTDLSFRNLRIAKTTSEN